MASALNSIEIRPDVPGIPWPQTLGNQQMMTLLEELPRINESQLIQLGKKDEMCSICFVPFMVLLTEEEMAHAMDSPAQPMEDMGVTKLSQSCGHMFCRRDITKWILDGNTSCPVCRRRLVENPSPNQQPTVGQDAEAAESIRATGLDSDTARSLIRDLVGDVDSDVLRDFMVNWQSTSAAEDTDRSEFTGMYS